MQSKTEKSCASCGLAACGRGLSEKYPEFCPTAALDQELMRQSLAVYDDDAEILSIAQASAAIEVEFYCRMTRVEETLELIRRRDYQLVGVATCVGMLNEARIFCSLLQEHGIRHIAVGCKVGAVDKSRIGIPDNLKLKGGCVHESMCNPVLQALYLNSQKTDFNVMIGLCVGHDSMFLRKVEAPTSVLIAKDRVLAHNPAGALYTLKSYYSRLRKKNAG